MSFNFRGVGRDQQFLLAPDVREWLPEGHLAWFIVDVVGELDLSGFEGRYRADGRGGAAYDPARLLAVLLYAYCMGDRSSRVIERRLSEDVAYRVLAANDRPDHATIARFRSAHQGALGELFAQVLGLCAAAGMVRVGVLAVDGTKMEAAASKEATMDRDRLERAINAQVAKVLAEAAAADAADDARFGDARGDELPVELADPATRLGRLRDAKARLDADAAARQAAREAEETARRADQAAGRRRRGRPRTKPDRDAAGAGSVNVTDPDSRMMKGRNGFLQGYNAQAVATEGQVIVAAEVVTAASDAHQLVPMLDAARANLDGAGVEEPVTTLLADAGYYSAANATSQPEGGTRLLIATTKAHKISKVAPERDRRRHDIDERHQARLAAYAAIFDEVAAGALTMSDAAGRLGLAVGYTYGLAARYQAHGIAGLPKRTWGVRRPALSDTTRAAVKADMQTALASPDGQALYKRRSVIIEPVFGQIKSPRGIRRFQRRGLEACASEWKLVAATHNLLKLWRHHTTLAA